MMDSGRLASFWTYDLRGQAARTGREPRANTSGGHCQASAHEATELEQERERNRVLSLETESLREQVALLMSKIRTLERGRGVPQPGPPDPGRQGSSGGVAATSIPSAQQPPMQIASSQVPPALSACEKSGDWHSARHPNPQIPQNTAHFKPCSPDRISASHCRLPRDRNAAPRHLRVAPTVDVPAAPRSPCLTKCGDLTRLCPSVPSPSGGSRDEDALLALRVSNVPSSDIGSVALGVVGGKWSEGRRRHTQGFQRESKQPKLNLQATMQAPQPLAPPPTALNKAAAPAVRAVQNAHIHPVRFSTAAERGARSGIGAVGPSTLSNRRYSLPQPVTGKTVLAAGVLPSAAVHSAAGDRSSFEEQGRQDVSSKKRSKHEGSVPEQARQEQGIRDTSLSGQPKQETSSEEQPGRDSSLEEQPGRDSSLEEQPGDKGSSLEHQVGQDIPSREQAGHEGSLSEQRVGRDIPSEEQGGHEGSPPHASASSAPPEPSPTSVNGKLIPSPVRAPPMAPIAPVTKAPSSHLRELSPSPPLGELLLDAVADIAAAVAASSPGPRSQQHLKSGITREAIKVRTEKKRKCSEDRKERERKERERKERERERASAAKPPEMTARHRHVLECYLCGQGPDEDDKRKVVFCANCPRKACLLCQEENGARRDRTGWMRGEDEYGVYFVTPLCGKCLSSTDDDIPPREQAMLFDGVVKSPSQLTSGDLEILLERLIDWLQDHDLAHFFVEDVDPEEYPDYSQTVKHPMNLNRMRKRLAAGDYSERRGGLIRVMEDVDWIRHNCMVFNGDEQAISRCVEILLRRASIFSEHYIEPLSDIRGSSTSNTRRPETAEPKKRRSVGGGAQQEPGQREPRRNANARGSGAGRQGSGGSSRTGTRESKSKRLIRGSSSEDEDNTAASSNGGAAPAAEGPKVVKGDLFAGESSGEGRTAAAESGSSRAIKLEPESPSAKRPQKKSKTETTEVLSETAGPLVDRKFGGSSWNASQDTSDSLTLPPCDAGGNGNADRPNRCSGGEGEENGDAMSTSQNEVMDDEDDMLDVVECNGQPEVMTEIVDLTGECEPDAVDGKGEMATDDVTDDTSSMVCSDDSME